MSLSRTFPCSADQVGRLLDMVREVGAQVEGDERTGRLAGDTFMGRFEGTYDWQPEQLTLTITRRPPLVTEAFLQARLDDMARRFGAS